jgi:hypothetical protein
LGGRIQRTDQARVPVQVGPGLDVEVGGDRDHADRLREPRREEHRERPAAAVADPDQAIDVTPAQHAPQRGRHARDDGRRIPLGRPDRGGARWRGGEAVVARPAEIEARRRVEGHEPEYEGIPWRGVRRRLAPAPRPAVAVDVDVKGPASGRRSGRAEEHHVPERLAGDDRGIHPGRGRDPGETLAWRAAGHAGDERCARGENPGGRHRR